MIVRNNSEMHRVWPDLSTVSGHTLDLAPGEHDMLPEDPGDVAYLDIRPANPESHGGQ